MLEILARLFVGIFVVSALLNAAILVGCTLTGRRSSMLPIFGGFFGVAGFWLTPGLRPFAWVPLILDVSTVPIFFGLSMMVLDAWKTSRLRLVAHYRGTSGNRVVELRLYRQGVGTIRQKWVRPPGEPGVIELSRLGGWARNGDRIDLQLGEETAHFRIEWSESGESLHPSDGYPMFEIESETTLDPIPLSRVGPGSLREFP